MSRAFARRTDPATSHMAAAFVNKSGTAATQRAKCLAVVKRQPGLTAAEIAEITGLERHNPSRRLPEMRKDGLVANGEHRMCRVVKRLSMTWYAVANAPPKQTELF